MEVNAYNAFACTTKTMKFLWWVVKTFDAKFALAQFDRYWVSSRGAHDTWEAYFAVPQKIDVITIHWKLPPRYFRIYFKLNMNGPEIPATTIFPNRIDRTNAINYEHAIVLNKPIIARFVKIAMNEPKLQNRFSIDKIRFFVKASYVVIKNSYVNSCRNMCLFVNTDKPRPGTSIEVYNCSEAIVTGNNNEMFIYTGRRALLHMNSKLCVAFDHKQDIVLQKCSENKPEYRIQFHDDNSLYFEGFPKDCIYIEDTPANNYVNTSTNIIVTSQADDMTYKKENIQSINF
jgi:hypothetical protein